VPPSAALTTDDAHAAAIAAIEEGRIEDGRARLRELVAAEVDAEHMNDLAVATQMSGDLDTAEALLRAAREIAGDRPDITENLATLSELRAAVDRGWREAPGIAGHDPGGIPERAHPGMSLHATLGEHCARYSLAIGMVGGLDVLDLGCGTGYGSEMLSWSARRVRGFDIWEPEESQLPRWPGGAELNYGHDLCRDPLPDADAATMFEVLEHLPDPAAGLDLAFRAISLLLVSFPNPAYHGSHLNPHHLNDWPLEEVEAALDRAARRYHAQVSLEHMLQQGVTIVPGRDPNANFWLFVVRASDRTSR
jgi:2-polyprenyl-3-methyl-5-hydroxy-6-metoxy-1,4-benzoquinol methylase